MDNIAVNYDSQEKINISKFFLRKYLGKVYNSLFKNFQSSILVYQNE